MSPVFLRSYALIGAALLAGYLFTSTNVAAALYVAFGLAAVSAFVYRLRVGVSRGRGAWVLLTAGLACVVSADAIWAVAHTAGFDPSMVTGLGYSVGFLLIIIAVLKAARLRRPERDLISVLDGVTVAAALSIPVAVFWVAPALHEAGLPMSEQVKAVTYPILDMVLIVVGVRFLLGSGSWKLPSVLLAVGLGLALWSSVAYNAAVLAGTFHSPDPVDIGWMAAYLVWGIAALHPAAATVLEPGLKRHGVGSAARLWVLVVIAAAPVAVVSYSYAQGTPLRLDIIWIPLGIMVVAMVARLTLLARARPDRWQGPALLTAACFVVIFVAIGLTQLVAAGNRQGVTATRFGAVAQSAEQLNHAAFTDLLSPPDVARLAGGPVAVASRRLQDTIDAVGMPAGAPQRARLQRLADRYLRSLDAAMRAQGSRAVPPPASIMALVVAHSDLVAGISSAALVYGSQSVDTAQRTRLASIAVLVLAAFVLGLLLLRFDRVRTKVSSSEASHKAARDSAARFRALVSGSANILTVIDHQTRVIAYPETVAAMLGFPESEITGMRLESLLPEADGARTRAALAALAEHPGASETMEWSLRRADGSRFDAEASLVNQLDDPLIQGYVLGVRDVSDRTRLEAELEHRAFHDLLTGLPNRGLIADRLAQALGRSIRDVQLHALVLLDLDDFKSLNDSLGHRAGDELLRQVGVRLGQRLRTGDTLARIGGDGFALLAENIGDSANALASAERLVEGLAEPFDLGDGTVHVLTGSVGLVISDGSGLGTPSEQAAEMLRDVELAMYEAKRVEGSHIEEFQTHMHEAVTERLQIRGELVRALERGDFTLVYQPLVDIDSRTIKGYEALVRWIHPERGMISPAAFIPAAEESGLIVELGTWVLREACRQLAEWQPAFPAARYVSVNVAGQQLQRADFPQIVAAALRDSGLPADQLVLEVTESSLIQDTSASERRIDELRTLGIRMAIDDFGTGYSSLSYLHRFAVDILKIDKSFIDHLTEAGPGSALVEAIVTMARSLRLTVVAEGIEEPEQVDALLAMNCALGQGYHYSRPLPAGDVPEFELAAGPSGKTVRALATG